jgi:pyruvate formate-lyase activating enzyme-like uncharacterized protein
MRGAKLVLFVTGRCRKACFYCPLSEERYGRDVIFANEIPVAQVEQALKEAHMIDAEGVGITGGEPLLEIDRTCQYLKAFKQEFGERFHAHLYTALEPVPVERVAQLLDAGLDELRLHRFKTGDDLDRLRAMTEGTADLGLEVPALPGQLKRMKQLLRDLDAAHLDFVNINELEYGPLNADQLHTRGFVLDSKSVAAVRGSEKTAITLLDWATEHTSLNVHFCPLALKDGVQLRNRFRRRAKHVAAPFERINSDGLLVKGVIHPPAGMSLTEALGALTAEFRIPTEQLRSNGKRECLESSLVLVRRLATQLKKRGFRVGVAQEYPIESRFQVLYTPL